MKKIFYISLGFISLGIGIAGIVLPVVPTTPLVLLSAFCFSRSSEKFDIWLRQTKVYKY
ncbi:YbaN family protein, partial [Streptococcus agalactiae]